MTSFRTTIYVCPRCLSTVHQQVMSSTSSWCWPDGVIPPDVFKSSDELSCSGCKEFFDKNTAEQFEPRSAPITPDIFVRLNYDEGGDVWRSYRDECKTRFSTLDDDQLIDTFNQQVGSGEWTGRGYFLSILHEEFYRRQYDYSEIGDHLQLSLERKIQLNEKKIIAIGELIAGISKERLGNSLDYYPILETS